MRRHKFLSIIRPYRWKLALIVVVNLLSILLSITTMLLIEPLMKLIFQGHIDGLSAIGTQLMKVMGLFVDVSQPQHSLMAIIIFVVVLFFLKNLFTILTQWLLAPVRSDVIRQLRNRMYHKVLLLPLSFFTHQKKGDFISRAVNDTQEIEFTVLSAFQTLLTALLTIIIYVAALFTISTRLTLFSLILLPIAGFFISLISRKLRKKNKEMKELQGVMLSHVEETLAGLRVIKGFNAQAHAEGVFDRHNKSFTDTHRHLMRRADLASPMSEFPGVTAVMIILVFGGSLVLGGDATLTAPLFITYIALFAMIVNPAKNVGTAMAGYHRGMAALDRIYEVLDAEELPKNCDNPVKVKSFDSSIVFDHVSFSYTETEVLKEINIEIPKGKMVAVVGASGAGKTTLADLLPRFYDVTAGAIRLDGTDLRQLDIDSLRSLFSIVSQDVVLFNDTVANNIAFGSGDYTEEQIWVAARAANAAEFIEQLPDGLSTNIGDRGLTLSGGQRQRLSIARAVLRNTPLLILDEATSAMDTESERLVQEALDRVMQNRTTLVIAHRLSTIRHADNIIVLDAGRVAEQGTHDELMALNGKYAKFVEVNQQS